MAESTATATPQPPATDARRGRLRAFMQATEIDPRLLGMVVALLVIWIGFHWLSHGKFLTDRNLWFLSVQTASIAIMATGMVLVIVSRNIDLSIGSIVGFVGMCMGAAQTQFLADIFGYGSPWVWILALAIGLAIGAGIGLFQGFLIAYVEIPSFIVTLGGLLVWRGAAWWVANGKTLAPLDATFQLLGGGPRGSLGADPSWVVAFIACIGIVAVLINSRRQRRRFAFALRPIWAEVLLGVIGCAVALGAVSISIAYPWPAGLARQYAQEHGISAEGLVIPTGIAIPVLLALVVAVVMTVVATRRRFGRYVFAIGGNPEAAELGGINTRRTVMKVFALMGFLAAISAAVSIARLNASTNALGDGNELYTIAAAVIGGTSFAGGIGTIPGAVLGALVMQSLQSGMVLVGIDTPIQNIVAGIVLVVAVGLDTWYRRRTA